MEDWKQELEEILEEETDTGRNMIPKYARCYARIILENFISQEIEKARGEGEIEVLKDMQKVWDNDNLGDAPKYGSAGAGLMKRWIRDDINERLSKFTTK